MTSVFLGLGGSLSWAQGAKPVAPTYARDIKPILEAHCTVCHSKTTTGNMAVSGGLALDTLEAIKKGVGGRPVLAAGKSADSELYKRLVAMSASKLMPKGGPALPKAKIDRVKAWIDAGAPTGDLSKVATKAAADPASAPLPANPASLDLVFPLTLAPTPDLVTKTTPPDAKLAYGMKIGPLPPVTALAYSPDGKRLAVGGYRAVILWDTATGKPTDTLTGLTGAVQSLAFRADGAQLAVASGAGGVSGEVRVYDCKTWKPVEPLLTGHTDIIYSVAWSKDGNRLATASHDKTARLWEWPSGKEVKVFRDHSDAVSRVCFSPDGKSLYTGSFDHTLRRYDTANGNLIRTFSGHEKEVTAMALTPDGKGLVSSGPEARIRWWNPEDGNTTRYSDGSGATVNEIVFSADGKLMLAAGADKVARVWDANGGEKDGQRAAQDWLYSVAIHPDGKTAVAAGAEGVVRLWQVSNGQLRVTFTAWPVSGKAPEWIAITPEGYTDGSDEWSRLLRPQLAGKAIKEPRIVKFLAGLRQPESVSKAWQNIGVTPISLPAPAKPAEPAKKAEKPAAKTK